MGLTKMADNPHRKGKKGIGYRVLNKTNGTFFPVYFPYNHSGGFDVGVQYESCDEDHHGFFTAYNYNKNFHTFLRKKDAEKYMDLLASIRHFRLTLTLVICKVQWSSKNPIFGYQIISPLVFVPRDRYGNVVVHKYMTILEECN